MTKEHIFYLLDKNGITGLVINYPNTPKEWVLEYLTTMDIRESTKNYYTRLINENFK